MPRLSEGIKNKEMSEPKTIKLYNNSVEVKFYGDGVRHSYFVNGKRAKSVTGAYAILAKNALLPWALSQASEHLEQFIGKKLTQEMIDEAENKAQEIKTEASKIGTEAHAFVEAFVKGEKPEMPDDKNVLQAVNGWLEWVDKNKIKFTSAEKIVYSKKHHYIGTMDATARINGKRGEVVIDYKVANGLYAPVAYQTAAYQMADTEENEKEYLGRWAIRLSKETEEEYQIRQEKKLRKWLRKNPDKEPYEISPYVPFEAKLLPQDNLERDFKAHLLCMQLSEVHYAVEKEFWSIA